MNVLIACEESQRVCLAFLERGHNAFSCDIQEPSGGRPDRHILGDALKAIQGGQIVTMDGVTHDIPKWDLLIAHPPCTYLTVTGNRWFNVERYGDKARQRLKDREQAAAFFMAFVNANCDMIAIENPIGYMSTAYRKADQVIQPYMFGHPTRKATCLWLKGLPKLKPTNIVEVDTSDYYEYVSAKGTIKHDARSRSKGNKSEWAKNRSKTYPCIAAAMADQWGCMPEYEVQLTLTGDEV